MLKDQVKLKHDGDWICTDSDANQYGRQISETVYEFSEGEKHKHNFKEETIDLKDYSQLEIEQCINAYGYTLNESSFYLKNIVELYGQEKDWVIAECLFEQI